MTQIPSVDDEQNPRQHWLESVQAPFDGTQSNSEQTPPSHVNGEQQSLLVEQAPFWVVQMSPPDPPPVPLFVPLFVPLLPPAPPPEPSQVSPMVVTRRS